MLVAAISATHAHVTGTIVVSILLYSIYCSSMRTRVSVHFSAVRGSRMFGLCIVQSCAENVKLKCSAERLNYTHVSAKSPIFTLVQGERAASNKYTTRPYATDSRIYSKLCGIPYYHPSTYTYEYDLDVLNNS